MSKFHRCVKNLRKRGSCITKTFAVPFQNSTKMTIKQSNCASLLRQRLAEMKTAGLN